MDCTPAGQSTPATYWSQEIRKRNKLQIVTHSLPPRRLAMPLLSPGESGQTLTQWTVYTKGIGIFTTVALFIQNHNHLKAHQWQRLIHYKWLDSVTSTTALYTNTDSFPACDFISISL